MNPQQAADGQAEINEATNYVRIARESSPKNFFITMIDFYVHCVTVGLAISANESGWAEVKHETDRLAAEIESNRSSAIGLTIVVWYYEMVQDDENVERLLPLYCKSAGARLPLNCREFGRGTYHAESPVFSNPDLPVVEQIANALFALDDPKQREIVARKWQDELFNDLRKSRHVTLVLSIPLLLGDGPLCRKLAEEVLD